MTYTLALALDVLIQLLKVPVLILAAVLLYRLDRIIASGMRSAEVLEDAAENLERSSETFRGLTDLAKKIPGFGGSSGGEKQ
ncbi:hypothetical protein GLT92_00785 [Nanohaloarchaea archaeon]|jgi:hypothetical protein|nr:hypothetical protein [Candidatus Nanohaloarchaea archaeon]